MRKLIASIFLVLILISSIIFDFHSAFAGCENTLIVRREKVVLEEKEIPGIDFKQQPDTTFFVPSANGSGDQESVFLVKTLEFLDQIVRSKIAFSVYKIEGTDETIILLSPWKDPEKASSHQVINKALVIATGNFQAGSRSPLSPKGLLEVERGYLRPTSDGGYEIYELSGSMFSYRGAYGERLSEGAERVRTAFFRNVGVRIRFVEE